MPFTSRILLTGLFALALAGPVLAGQLTPGLEALLAEKASDDNIEVLLVLKDRVDVKSLDLQLHSAKAPLADRHATVLASLQDRAAATQSSLLADLEVRLQLGEIESYESFWIINAVSVVGREDAIRELAARDDIDVVERTLPIELIEPVTAGGDDLTLAIGITPGVVNVGARRVWSDLGINGSGALVCNFDTGVDGNHPALFASWRGRNNPASECWLDLSGGSSFPYDADMHGTHTMGTMIGLASNDTIGVAPGAQWIAANTIIGGSLNSKFLTSMQWLMDPDGDPSTTDDVPDVVNHSWGVNESFGYPDCYSAWWETIDAAEAAGMVHCWATGNEGPYGGTVRSPADRATTAYDSFSVGSTSAYPPFNISSFSSRGPAGPNCGPEELRIKPEIVAPGGNIYSSIPGGGYTYMGGTSMATPHVAGVVALMRSANPELDTITIKQIIMDTALDRGADGEDNIYGHGFIDAYQAVLAAMEGYGLVAGTVIDEITNLPIVGAEVTVSGSQQRQVTDENGDFRLSLPAGPATLQISFFGYEDFAETFEVPAGEEINPELALVQLPQVTFSGTVHAPGTSAPGQAPQEGVNVVIDGTPLAGVTTGSDGRWEIAVPSGTDYTVRASLSGQGSVAQTLPADMDRDCDLYLRASAEDGFESGDLAGMNWSDAGNAYWTVESGDAYEGNFAAQSGTLGSSQTSILRLDVDVPVDGELTFWYKVIGGNGTLAFWDGLATIQSWETADWTQYSYPVTAGEHTFRWRFNTTSEGGSGDRGLIDLVVLPGGDAPAPRAVVNPWTVSVEAAPSSITETTLLVLNQGVENLSWSLSSSAGWLDLDPATGTILPAGYEAVTLTIDTYGLAEGSHSTQLTLVSDDPDNPVLPVQVLLQVGTTTDVGDGTPQAFALRGAVPNPFNPQTTVHFSLPASQSVRLRLYDVQGRLVRSLVDGVRPAGANQVLWDGRDDSGHGVASGTYFARLEAGGLTSVKSMVLVR